MSARFLAHTLPFRVSQLPYIRHRVFLWLVFLGCVLHANSAGAAPPPIPILTSPVVDQARLLSPQDRQALTERLRAFERSKGSQIVVLTVPSLEGDSIEHFAISVASAWRLGRKGIDDGVLLLVAPHERQVRIEVGRGLEGVLTDVTAFRIIDTQMTPLFKDGEIAEGISLGVSSIMAVVNGEPLPPPPRMRGRNDSGVFFFLIALFYFVGTILTRFIGREPAAIASGLLAFVGGLLIATTLFGIVLGIITFIFLLFPESSRRGGQFLGGGGFSTGGFGGGFGGGGGSFSGGGASGRW